MNGAEVHEAIKRSVFLAKELCFAFSPETEKVLDAECNDSRHSNNLTKYWGWDNQGHEWCITIRFDDTSEKAGK